MIEFSLTYIITDEVRMVLLNAIVQDSHHNTFSCVALSPGYFSVQVLMHWAGLKEKHVFNAAVNQLWLTPLLMAKRKFGKNESTGDNERKWVVHEHFLSHFHPSMVHSSVVAAQGDHSYPAGHTTCWRSEDLDWALATHNPEILLRNLVEIPLRNLVNRWVIQCSEARFG